MIEYDNDFETMTLSCENCSAEDDFEGSWNDCIEEAKADGWRIIKVDGDWKHYCEDCKNEI